MIDWDAWLRRWDVQQTHYIPAREERFAVMLDVCAALLPEDFVALDLACGPGAVSQRLLARFPHARVIALDYNPILLHLGQQVVSADQGRVQWIKANLMAPDWTSSVRAALAAYGQPHIDAVLTTTAMHWLSSDVLTRVYGGVGELVRDQGVYIDGDNLAFPPSLPVFRQITQQVNTRIRAHAVTQPGSESYTQWWAALLGDLRTHAPQYDQMIAEYERTDAERVRGKSEPILALHEAALLNAGFTQIGTVWQHWDDRVLLAIKGAPTDDRSAA